MKEKKEEIIEPKEIGLEDIKCPVCGNPINWVKPVGDYHFNRTVVLLAKCWSGDSNKPSPEHLFLIKLNELPEVIKYGDSKEERE